MRIVSPLRFGIFIASTITIMSSLIAFAINPTVATVPEGEMHQAYPDYLNEYKELKSDSVVHLKIISEPKTELYAVTAYCSCEKCCGEWADGITYSGDFAHEGITIAADLNKLPLGTKVWIEGLGERVVQDKGGAIKGNRIDVFFYNHYDALKFGKQELEVTILD